MLAIFVNARLMPAILRNVRLLLADCAVVYVACRRCTSAAPVVKHTYDAHASFFHVLKLVAECTIDLEQGAAYCTVTALTNEEMEKADKPCVFLKMESHFLDT
eukprot:6186787-Pleurochrysis_carterae.AAC.3